MAREDKANMEVVEKLSFDFQKVVAIGESLLATAMQRLTALEMNTMLNLTPLGTVLLAWWLLEEQVGLVQMTGMIVMIIGVLFVQCPQKSLTSG